MGVWRRTKTHIAEFDVVTTCKKKQGAWETRFRMVAHRNILDLRRRGKALNAKDVIWDDIAKELKIYTQDGRINPGLAYRIIMEDYEPKRPETRARLGLVGMCPYCHRKVGERLKRKDLFSTSTKDLKWMFENRQEM